NRFAVNAATRAFHLGVSYVAAHGGVVERKRANVVNTAAGQTDLIAAYGGVVDRERPKVPNAAAVILFYGAIVDPERPVVADPGASVTGVGDRQAGQEDRRASVI